MPQGSNLGPLLFLLYVDDITAHISNSHCLLYADDLKLYRVINCEEDCRLLQEDLNRVSRWGDNNDLLLNTDKCHIVSYSRKLNVGTTFLIT